jgi:galactoside O-acetyltransferase
MNSLQYDKTLLCRVGKDVFISVNVEIRRPQLVSVGKHTAIDTGLYLTTSAEIGDYIHIAPYVTIIGGPKAKFIMRDFATIAAGSRIICGSDEHKGRGLVGPTIPEQYRDPMKLAPVTFERFANIGTNVVVMPGVTLGEGCVVGACSLVTKSTEPWGIYIGTPAKKIGERPKNIMLQFAKELGYE